MRLTPFRTHSSMDATQDEPSIDVEIYHLSNGASERVRERPTVDSILESDPPLVAVLEEVDTPATVDEVADQLIDPGDRLDIETWGDVHEHLYRVDLPELDAAGVIEFDAERGIVGDVDDP